MKWLHILRSPNYEITITVFQALILLAQKYQKKPFEQQKYEAIKKLCLSGVRTQKDEKLLEALLNDATLSRYRISSRKKDINQDAVRRYFESHLAHETLLDQLDNLDGELLSAHLDFILIQITAASWEDMYRLLAYIPPKDTRAVEYSEAYRALSQPDTYPSFKSTNDKAARSQKWGRASPIGIESRFSPDSLFVERKRKMGFLAKCMYAAEKYNVELESRGIILDIYAKEGTLFSDDARGRAKKIDPNTGRTQSIRACSLGVMSSLMPLQRDDALALDIPSPYTRPVDRYSAEETPAKATEPMFKTLVTPFVASLSGTMLIKLRVIAQLLRDKRFVYQDMPEQLKLFLQLHIAFMVYQGGGHSLDEYVRVLQLPEVQDELGALPGFASFSLERLFKTDNEVAFNHALNRTMTYNRHILAMKQVQAALHQRRLLQQKPNTLGTVSLFFQQKELQYVVMNQSWKGYVPLFILICLLDEKYLSAKKDASLAHMALRFLGVLSVLMVAKVLGEEVVDARTTLRNM
ncbi:MAG: hypothetical protein P1U32_08480 [Legionellaceae bacterium]|nr:hypothetical protein [Legionellaceae bacterium]